MKTNYLHWKRRMLKLSLFWKAMSGLCVCALHYGVMESYKYTEAMIASFQGTITVKSIKKKIIKLQKCNKRSVNKKWEVCEYGTNLSL